MAERSKIDIGRARIGSAADRMERVVAEHIEQHDARKALAQGGTDEERSMPLPVVVDGNLISSEPLEQAKHKSAPAFDSMRSDRGASMFPEASVGVESDPMLTSGVDPDMDLSMVASGRQLTVARGVKQLQAPTLQEPFL